jgi:predicted amidophosphoribosyltransferase
MLTPLLELVAPTRCAGCGVRAALPWCAGCLDAARTLRWRGGCTTCAGNCSPASARCPLQDLVVGTTAAFAYTGVVARTVVAAKLRGHHAAWWPLGAHLGAVVARTGTSVDVVAPVPTEPGRARRRGFDHARILADAVGHVLDVPSVPVLRTRPRTPDRGKGAATQDLPSGAIQPTRALDGRHLLLVDDVLTTGATIRAAARAARAGNAGEVHVAVLARAAG